MVVKSIKRLHSAPIQAVGNCHSALRRGIQYAQNTRNDVSCTHWMPHRGAAWRLPTAWIAVGFHTPTGKVVRGNQAPSLGDGWGGHPICRLLHSKRPWIARWKAMFYNVKDGLLQRVERQRVTCKVRSRARNGRYAPWNETSVLGRIRAAQCVSAKPRKVTMRQGV